MTDRRTLCYNLGKGGTRMDKNRNVFNLGFTSEEIKNHKLKCETCNENLFIKLELLGESKFFPVMCKCRKAEIKRREKEEENIKIRQQIEELVANDLMSKNHIRNTFENDLYPSSKVSRTCRKYVENWRQMKAENIGLLLTGEVGQGKTFYACCIANELIKQNYTVAITTTPKILTKLTKFTEENDKLVQRLKQVQLLVIDDFGIERKTEYATEQIFTLIDDRLSLGLPTIITTNIDFSQWKAESITEQRLKDRILELCSVKLVVKTESKSLRKLASAKKAKKFIECLNIERD